MSKYISNVADVIDCLHSTPEYSKNGFPIARVEDINDWFINYDNCLKVTKEICDEHNRNHVPTEGDIVITRVGSFGRMAYVKDKTKFCLGQNISIIVPKENPKFIYYYLKSPYAQKFIHGNSNGSSYKSLSLAQIKNIPFKDEGLNKKRIGELLFNIDLKIDNNNKTIKKLEEYINKVYEYWFYQFEFPNENNKPYFSSNGEMIWNDKLKRNIPKEWKVENLKDNSIMKIVNPGIKKFTGEKQYLATADVVNNDIISSSNITYDNRESRANMQPVENSVWFAKMKNSIKHIFVAEYSKELLDNNIFSTGFLGLQCKNKEYLEYIYSVINAKVFEIHKDKLAHGATQEAVNNEDIKLIPLLIPTEEVIIKFNKYTQSALKKIYNCNVENSKLISYRDFILPLLYNGQAQI